MHVIRCRFVFSGKNDELTADFRLNDELTPDFPDFDTGFPPQNDEQVVAVLDDRGSEAALPDVAAGSLSPVVPPGVSDGQGLEDAADRLPGGRLEKQMKMVGHQAVAEERERVPCLGAGEIAKEHIPFAVGAEDIGSVVPAVDRVVNKVIACRSWKSSHESNLPT